MSLNRVLLVEDSQTMAHLYAEYLGGENLSVTHVSTGSDALDLLAGEPPDAVLLDLALPDMNGMQVLEFIHAESIETNVVIITAHGNVARAVQALSLGALDFLEKPFDKQRLLVTLNNALERGRLAHLVDALSATNRQGYEGFIGSSPPMQAVYQIIDSAAPSSAPVFICGESGTGKEVCARALHERSRRRDGPMVALNCAAIPRDLMESEIFGHVRGAFTGAVGRREGAASQARGGTLFLDEICEMDLDLQAKLLRFTQTGAFTPVGGSSELHVDVRFVCATNRNPLSEIKAGRFREDLYYRLHVIPLDLPPLRERGKDILLLAEHFLRAAAREEGKSFEGLDDDVSARLMSHPWVGNVRELQNVMRQIVVMQRGGRVTTDMLPSSISPPSVRAVTNPVAERATRRDREAIRPLAVIEREAIEAAIAACDGNVPRAAAYLEVSPSTLYRKIKSWG